MATPLLGKVLLDNGYISADHLKNALAQQKAGGAKLGQILLEIEAIDEETLALGLAQQVGFDLVDPVNSAVDPELLTGFSRDVAIRLQTLPLVYTGPQTVTVAMANPFDLEARRELEFVLGRGIQPLVCRAQALRDAIGKHYGLEKELAAILRSVKPEQELAASHILDIDLEEIEKRLRVGGARPYIDLLNFLLGNAHNSRASDIHVEPLESGVQVRYRIDGVLRSAMKLPKWVESGLVSRIKVVGNMDLSIHHLPQDGKVRAHIGGRDQDLRISSIPSQFGETCVLRILDPDILQLDLGDLGLVGTQLNIFYRLISQPQGMVLITGPTGSGKSTSLYATINRLQTEQTKIVSVEDPVEYTLGGVTQVQVDDRRGMTFANSIRSLLRQDPNVLVIGEIRDEETAATAFQAALTGHLVFSTLHTVDTISTITRLRDLGLPLYLTGSSLLGVVAQRLVRRLCPQCKVAAAPDPSQWRALEMEPRELASSYRPGPGCKHCLYTGYRGRVGIFELLRIDESLRNLILAGADEMAIRRAAVDGGMEVLLDTGIKKVEAGLTSLEELVRHVRSTIIPSRIQAQQRDTAAPPPAPPAPAAPDEAPEIGQIVSSEPLGDAVDTLPGEAVEMLSGEFPQIPFTEADVPEKPDDAPETILVVDDSQEILDLVRYTLEGVGFRVLTAMDGQEALETVDRHRVNDPVHLVVLDVMMPGMTGFEVCEHLKQDIATAFLPVLILSARGDQAHIKSGFKAGADDYLPKPFDPEELELRIRALLRRAYRDAPL
jgi:type IV pilus assembly protein PilB